MLQRSKHMIRYAGAIVAYLIGSGFASGQEVMQFFTAYGPVWGTFGGCLTAAIMAGISVVVLRDAKQLELKDANKIFRYYCGNTLGCFFEWLMPIFLMGIYVIMLSGAGALLQEYYGLSPWAGRMLILMLSLATVLLGLEKLTDIIGRIGPVIIVMMVFVSVVCIIKNPSGILLSTQNYKSFQMAKATPFWWLSGIIYATFCGFTLMPFLAGIGKIFDSESECSKIGALGSFAFAGAALILNLGMAAYLPELHSKAVPTVYMADLFLSGLGLVYSLILLAGIYTTATPMLWSVVNKLCPDDKSLKFRIVAVILAVIAYFSGRLPFGALINFIYPYMGYLGIVVFVCVAVKHVRNNSGKEHAVRKTI